MKTVWSCLLSLSILLLSVTRAPLLKLPSMLNGKPVRGLHIGRIL